MWVTISKRTLVPSDSSNIRSVRTHVFYLAVATRIKKTLFGADKYWCRVIVDNRDNVCGKNQRL